MSALLEALGGILVSGLGYLTARLMLPLLTFGALRAERPAGEGPFRWHGLRMVGATLVVQAGFASILGLVVWLAAIVAGLAYWRG